MTSKEAIAELAEANRALVQWMQLAGDHAQSKFRHDYVMVHYSIFVQLRQALLRSKEIDQEYADKLTAVAGGSFVFTRTF